MTEYTKELATFLATHTYEQIPDAVVERAKDVILDTLGCMLYGRTTPSGNLVADLVATMGTGDSTLVGDSRKVPMPAAVLANGVFAHADEFDDRNTEGQTHPSGAILGSALAVAEGKDIDGKRLLLAFIMGHEASARVAAPVAPDAYYNGFHPAGWGPTLGAAASAGVVQGVDAQHMTWALGLAVTYASGSTEVAYSSDAKILHTGKAGQGGLWSALLAARGFTGGEHALEGSKRAPGYFRMLTDKPKLEKVLNDLGVEYKMYSRGALKPYSAAGDMHPGIDALWTMAKKHDLKPDDFITIEVASFLAVKTHFDVPHPDSRISALLSYQHSLAAAVLHGEVTPAQFRDEIINDPAMDQFRSIITLEVDEELDKRFPTHYCARVTAETTKGVFTEVCMASRGTPDNPLSRADVREKFLKLSAASVPADQAEQIYEAVYRLDSIDNVDELITLLQVK